MKLRARDERRKEGSGREGGNGRPEGTTERVDREVAGGEGGGMVAGSGGRGVWRLDRSYNIA